MDYIANNAGKLARMGLPTDKVGLTAVVRKYPWFTTGKILLSSTNGEIDGLLSLHLASHPTPQPLQYSISMEDFIATATREDSTADKPYTEDLIDKFLSGGDRRIVPNENMTDENVAIAGESLDIPDELMTEELADIYMKQGLTNQAEVIYRKLGRK